MEHYTTSESTDKVFKALHEFHKDPPPIVKEGTVSVPGRPERKEEMDERKIVRTSRAGVFFGKIENDDDTQNQDQ